MCRKCLKDLNIETLSNDNEPNEASPDDEYFWDFPETEFNSPLEDDDELA
jgi:hypothetical protein